MSTTAASTMTTPATPKSISSMCLDAHELVQTYFGDLGLSAAQWTDEPDPDPQVMHRWRTEEGTHLRMYRAIDQGAEELLAGDAVTLLLGGKFTPARPMIDTHRLSGRTTGDAPGGPHFLDVAAVEGAEGTHRLLLLRPTRPGQAPAGAGADSKRPRPFNRRGER